METKKSRPRNNQAVRNALNGAFILFALCFMAAYFIADRDLTNIYGVVFGLIAIVLKMTETVLRIMGGTRRPIKRQLEDEQE